MDKVTEHPEGALNLALAVVASSSAPLLLLDGDLTIIAASTSFYREFQIDPEAAPRRKLSELGNGEWNRRQLSSLLQATASGSASIDAYEMELKLKGQTPRQLVLNAQKLEYGDGNLGHVRLLVSVLDVTDARLAEKFKDDLVREKAILLQEVQHRVANSLQIIASILLQSARRVQSEETRTHLQSAHRRVMSIAALQRQLAASRLEDVELRPYMTELCKSLGASMIMDPDELSIEVNVDDSVITANVSLSLGLIVTELVINALKHAFPAHRSGKIVVDYHSNDARWAMSVSDNGVGIPSDPDSAKPGLGTGLVEAMARQLNAEFRVEKANPGTRASITHG
ncbi:sensor histidine kinase [Rhizobium terrae]|uniref:sensor histidine kinase n=1 Tax=Rhizobium terrae TaxID=2171756 RepID=UPI000E3C4CB6|nr:PAS domain-containing sensor histidine kinase [Rhizobium terrae]